MQSQPANVQRAAFGSVKRMFESMPKEEGDRIDFDVSSLKSVLFSQDVEIEAIRLLRADAVVAICKSSPTLASKIRTEVLARMEEERSAVVRDRLKLAPLPVG